MLFLPNILALASVVAGLSITQDHVRHHPIRQTAPSPNVMGAVGVGVTDIAKSVAFYTSVLGFEETGQKYSTAQFDEEILKLPGEKTGSALALMAWKIPKNVTNTGAKLVFFVNDMNATFAKLQADGREIVAAPGTIEMAPGVKIPTGFAKDRDGTLLEINPLSIIGALGG